MDKGHGDPVQPAQPIISGGPSPAAQQALINARLGGLGGAGTLLSQLFRPPDERQMEAAIAAAATTAARVAVDAARAEMRDMQAEASAARAEASAASGEAPAPQEEAPAPQVEPRAVRAEVERLLQDPESRRILADLLEAEATSDLTPGSREFSNLRATRLLSDLRRGAPQGGGS
jgi:hypothetical protein